jgi:hypothetical protein
MPINPVTPAAPGVIPSTTPAVPAAPVAPAAPVVVAPPAAPVAVIAKPKDIYNRKPAELKKPVDLAAPKNLGDVGGVNVVIGQDGSIGLGQVPTSFSEQLRAARVAVSKSTDSQPLAAVTDVATLKNVAYSASKLFDAALKTPKNDVEALEFRAGRASALALIEAAARQAGKLGDTATRDQLTLGLMFSIQKEPYKPLKAFAYESSLVRAEKGELTATKTAETALYPQKPPYEKWMKDGVIKIQHYTDNNGSPTQTSVDFYKDRGFKITNNPDGSFLATRAAKDGKPRMEVTIPTPPTHETPPSLFEKMGDDSVDMIIYAGHAGYGKRVDDALAKGVSGTGDGKLIMLMQCYGEGSIESLNRSFPDAQLISTREATDDNFDFTLMEHLFDGIDKKSDFKTIEKGVNKEFSEWVAALTPDPDPNGLQADGIQFYKDHPVETHYFYPHRRDVIVKKMDRDRDGVNDKDDSTFNIVYPKRMDAAFGYDPLDAGTPLDALDGTALNKATGQLNLFARYAVLPDQLLGNTPWNPEVFQPAGFFEGDSTNLNAFKFETDAANGKIKVSLNSNFAHAPAETLGRMLAIEGGAFVAKSANLDPAKSATLQLSMLERVVHQEGSTYNRGGLQDPAMQSKLLQARYQLPISVADVTGTTQNPDDFTAATFDLLAAKVAAGNLANLGASPKRATEALTVPNNVVLTGSIDKAAALVVAQRFGVAGTIDEANFGWSKYPSASGSLEIQMLDANGKKFLFTVGLDGDSVVRAASKISLE